jgi:feruloyl esterase
VLTKLIPVLLLAVPGFAATCENLSGLNIPNTTITMAQVVPAGEFSAPGIPEAQRAPFRRLPGFCRVAAVLRPTSDSEIKIEVWMSLENWNGKFLGVGNGGWSGAIVYAGLGNGVSHGYATASTNTGHDGVEAKFASGHPEKLMDFGYRAVHELTVKGKAITESFYTRTPARAYWNGCSSGGKQGLKEAQKFPNDYDGIVAGAPANYWTHLMVADLWPSIVTQKDPPATDLPPAALAVLHRAVLEACDSIDGVKDGLIEDPARCHFDPAVIACKGAETENCLTAAQVESARRIYAGAKNPRTGKQIFPAMTPGSELVWTALAGKTPFGVPLEHFRWVVFNNPAWDYRTLDLDKDTALADKLDNGLLNATDPNLKPFFGHGGKLLMYHGWNDQLIAPGNSVDYYESVVAKLGNVGDTYRLFMAPGMNHCGGGDGPSRVDWLTAMENWVEQGKAPDQMLAAHADGSGHVDRTRPLCPYPQVAKYKGSGSIDDAANFTCAKN